MPEQQYRTEAVEAVVDRIVEHACRCADTEDCRTCLKAQVGYALRKLVRMLLGKELSK